MKQFAIALAALSALAATPAMARSDTHISVGFYSPAPVYYQPAPVVYYPPVRHVYYAPRPYYGYYHRGRHERRYESAWNEPRGGYGYGRGGHR
jgi:hypothetical protein